MYNSTYRNRQWLIFLCHIAKMSAISKEMSFWIFLNSVFITSTTLFLQLYKVVLIFLGCLENNEKVQLKIWIMYSKK